MTVVEAVQRTLLLKARGNQHTMTKFRRVQRPSIISHMAYCERCWCATWVISSVSPPTYGGPAIEFECREPASPSTLPTDE